MEHVLTCSGSVTGRQIVDGICIVSISDKGEHLDFRTTALFLGPKFAGSGILPYHRRHGLC